MPVFDVNGNIIGYDQDFQSSNTDGAQGARNTSIVLYNGGGPATSLGIPSQQNFDRLRSVQGKALANATITATVVGDDHITCPTGAMKTVMPGQAIRLSTGGPVAEYVYVAGPTVYTPTPNATSIPLQQPVVQTGNTLASWDIFNATGAGLGTLLPSGVLPSAMSVIDANNISTLRMLQTANTDALAANNILAAAAVGYNGSAVSERMRSPNVYKPVNAQALTASSANTPTSIWTPASSKKFRLMGYWFSSTAAAGLIFHDLAAQAGTGLLPIPSPIAVANGEIKSPQNIGNGFLSAAANNQLWIDATVATTITGFVYGTEE